MKPLWFALLSATALVTSVVTWGPLEDGLHGQLVFVPGATQNATAEPPQSVLTVVACDATDSGLRVIGRVDASTDIVTVNVSDFDGNGPGTRVARAFAAEVASVDGARVGDFNVVLQWADSKAVFSVVEFGTDESATAVGPGTACSAIGGDND